MKTRKSVLSLVIVICLVLSINAVAFADSTASEARQGVAVIASYVQMNNEAPELWGYGSCVFVGEPNQPVQYLLTNHHVIQDYLDYGKGELISTGDGTLKMILRVHFSPDDYTEAYLVETDAAQDIAVLRLATPTTKRVALKLQIPDDSLVGSQIYTIGYPGYADSVVVDPTSKWGINDSLVTKGTVGRLIITTGVGTEWIQLADTQWNNGNSGGPLLNEKGAVVGLVSMGYSDENADMYVAANIKRATVIMDNNGIKYTLAGSEFPMEIALIAGGAVLLALLVLIIVKLSKKGKPPKTEVISTCTLPQRRATVRSLSVQHGGRRVELGTEQIFIGREVNCKIRFADGTPGISGVHCSIRWDAESGDFILMDMKSSYGTFLENGMKLNPHTPYRLRNGEGFYLAEPKNTLRVEVE